jgi:hypothetical protein
LRKSKISVDIAKCLLGGKNYTQLRITELNFIDDPTLCTVRKTKANPIPRCLNLIRKGTISLRGNNENITAIELNNN